VSGIKAKDIRRRPDRDFVCLLQGAHPPGKPLQLWYYDGLLSEMPEETDYDALSDLWKLLHYLYPEGSDE
jgi:hypothetical protein